MNKYQEMLLAAAEAELNKGNEERYEVYMTLLEKSQNRKRTESGLLDSYRAQQSATRSITGSIHC